MKKYFCMHSHSISKNAYLIIEVYNYITYSRLTKKSSLININLYICESAHLYNYYKNINFNFLFLIL